MTTRIFSTVFVMFLSLNGLFSQLEILLEPFASGLVRPVAIAHAQDSRLFVVEKAGRIRILNTSGQVMSTPFLDIRSKVDDTKSEKGLLGLAFHPDYANNGFFYLNYTTSDSSLIVRYQVNAQNPDIADNNSERLLFKVYQPYNNHNGGDLKFGPDGYLYVGLGDGGNGGDPGDRSQNLMNALGKMFRIDVDNGTPYSIPADNPFADDDFALDEIWSYGLRNPWRFSFDLETGDLFIADVGQDRKEEIHIEPANSQGGENYGWRCYEADLAFNSNNCGPQSNYTFPQHSYWHSLQDGCSITGGYVYRGSSYPGLFGYYIYTDYCSGRFWGLHQVGNDWQNVVLGDFSTFEYSSFGENQDGELFVASLSDGLIQRVVQKCNVTVAALVTDESCPESKDGSIELTPPALAMNWSFEWSNGDSLPSIQNLVPGIYDVTITDDFACQKSMQFDIKAGENPETPTIVLMGQTVSTLNQYADYQWYLGDVLLEQFNGQSSINVSSSGQYSLVGIDENDCESERSEAIEVIISAVEEFDHIELISVSPNPFQNRVEIKSQKLRNLEFSFMDVSGKQFFPTILKSSEDKWVFDVSGLPTGAYFLHWYGTGKQGVLRLVKG